MFDGGLTMALVEIFAPNTKGRDFIVGDIHGEFDLVLRAMDTANFDQAHDRLFSVGDLIDRGAGSHRCVKFLSQPYVHAVRGNHEDMLIDLYADGEPPAKVVEWMAKHNGFGWWSDIEGSMKHEILNAIRPLPIIIEIETSRGTVGIVHADVPARMAWPEFISLINAGDAPATKEAVWGRTRMRTGDDSGVAGVGRVVVGHTPRWNGLVQCGNVYAIDTGAVFGILDGEDYPDARLTMANIAMTTIDLVSPKPALQMIDLRNEDATPTRPFGSYVHR